jgi:hypothetical protein
MKSTNYFNEFASQKHPEVQREWIERGTSQSNKARSTG